jgi:hypothetical protein
MSKASKDGECFMALDKATQMNLKGKRLENFATDQYAFQKDQDLYSESLYIETNKPFSSTIHLELLILS